MKKSEENVNAKEKKAKNKKKKKGFSCCGCMLTVFVVVLVLVVGAAGVGIYFANDYIQNNFNMSLWDTFSVVGDLYSAPKDQIVTNAPSDGDDQAFYDGVNSALMLKEGTIDEQFIDDLIKEMGEQNTDPVTKGAFFSDGGGEEQENALAQKLTDILKRENIDMNKLAKFTDDYDYSANYNTDFILSFSDRQITAIINKVFTSALEEIADPKVSAVVSNLTFEQFILDNDGTNVKIIATLGIDVSKMLDSVLASMDGEIDVEIPQSAIGIVKGVLPKQMFVSLEIIVGDTITTDVIINKMDAQSRDRAHKLITGILKLSGETIDSREWINQNLTPQLKPAIDSLNEYLDLKNNVSKNTIKLDILSLIAENAFEDVTGENLAQLYTSVLRADADKMVEENAEKLFKNAEIDPDSGETIYSAQQAEQEFLTEFTSKYLMHDYFWVDENNGNKIYLNPTPQQVSTLNLTEIHLSFADVAALFGLGESELDMSLGLELADLLDTHGLTKAMGGVETEGRTLWFVNRPYEEMKFNLTDRMLGALVNSQVSSLLGDELPDLDLLFVNVTKGEEEMVKESDLVGVDTDPDFAPMVSITRQYVTLGLTIDTSFMGEDAQFISNLLGDKIGLIAKLDITPKLKESALNKIEFNYCDLSEERTEKLMETIEKIGVELFSEESLKDTLLVPVRSAITKIEEIAGELVIDNGKIILPDAFHLISTYAFPYDESKTYDGTPIVLGGDEIHELLQKLYNIPDVDIVSETEHYLVDVTTKSWGEGGDKIVPGDAESYYGAGKANNRVMAKGLTKLLAGEIPVGASAPDIDLGSDIGMAIGYYNDVDTMYLSFEYFLPNRLCPDDGEPIVPIDRVFATFYVDKTQTTSVAGETIYVAKLVVNDLTDAQMLTLQKMMEYLTPGGALDISKLELEIGALAYALENTPYFADAVEQLGK